MEYILYCLMYFVEVTKFYLVFRHILCLKSRKGIQTYILTLAGIVVLAMSEIVLADKYMLIAYVAIILVISFIMNKEKMLRMIIISIWSMFVISMLDTITHIAIGVIWKYSGTPIEYAMFSILCSLVTILFLVIVSIKYKRKLLLNKLGVLYYILFSAIVMANALIISMLNTIILSDANIYEKLPAAGIYIFIAISVFIQLFLIISLAISKNVYREKDELNRKYLKSEEEHYLYLENRERETKKFRHDIRAHIHFMQILWEKKDYDNLGKYIRAMEERTDQLGNVINVNNGFAEAILNQYHSICKQKGIVYRVEGHFPKGCKIEPFDICTILSNLLNNAVEANDKQSDNLTDKEIFLEIRYEEEDKIIFISIKNTYNGTVQYENGNLMTIKENSGNHGYGLENVRECVNKYHGEMYIIAGETIFTTNISLRNK